MKLQGKAELLCAVFSGMNASETKASLLQTFQ
jgi:hypothetical protein